MRHTHILQIIDDHQAMWFEAENVAEKRRIELRFKHQLILATVNFIGFEATAHGFVLAMIGDPYFGGVLFVAGLLVMHASGRGG